MENILKDVRLTFYGLVHLLIQKEYCFILETETLNGFTFYGKKDHVTVSHVTIPELPIIHDNMYVPIFKLVEVVNNLGVKPQDLINARIACHKHHYSKL